jgi:hypothetical protein
MRCELKRNNAREMKMREKIQLRAEPMSVCVCVCVCACVHACVVEGRKEQKKKLRPYGSFCALNCRELKQIENGV